MSVETPTADRAVCLTCGLRLPTEDDVRRHADETSLAARAAGDSSALSHRWRIVTKTADEIAAGRIRDAVEDALYDLFDDLDGLVDRGRATDEQVARELGWADLSDAWREHIEADR